MNNMAKFNGNAWQLNVGIAERLISAFGGAYLLVNALSKKEFPVPKTMVAGYLLFRGATGYCPAYEALGKTEVHYRTRNVNIKTSMTVNKPRFEVYRFWRRLENLPLFMKHLESVVSVDPEVSEWKAKIPGGLGTISWRSEIVKDEPGLILGWKSIEGSTIENAGKIEFKEAGKWGTEIHAVISYHPPVGVLGEKVAHLFNPAFKAMVKEDIRNLKTFLETSEISPISESSKRVSDS
jgi:uncharacterized membrane protein